MVRSTPWLVSGLLLCTAGVLVSLNGCGGGANSMTTPGPSASITASPNPIEKGQASTLTWQTSNATSVSIQGIGDVPASGSKQVTPTSFTAYTLTATGPGGTQQATAQVTISTNKILHVVVIFQENRSPDNLFQDPKLIAAGADIQNYGISAAQPGVKIPLTPVPLGCTPGSCDTYNPDHSHEPAFVDMCDLDTVTNQCKMDGAYKIRAFCEKKGDTSCLNGKGNYSYAYVQQTDVAPYFQLAETYTFADNMFQSNQGPSFPAHQYLISGSSAAAPPGMLGDNLLLAENPFGITTGNSANATGCTAPSDELVQLIDPVTGDESQSNQVYPCFDRPTLTDLLNANGLSWKYYAPSPGSIWTAPNAISHMCGPNATPPNATACTGPDWTNNVVLNSAQVLTDITSNQLAAVSWVIPTGQASDHPVTTDGSGPSWVASVVNAIGNSPYWANTAIIITWDDWGGWYDHVAPPIIPDAPKYEMGFRVPMIVVSPYANLNNAVTHTNVTHTLYEFGSILKFIENTLVLNNIAPTATVGYADQFPGTGDLSDCFDFTQTPLTFHTISAKFKAEHFLNDKRKPTDPDDD
jgi:phospholipase C